MLIKHDPSKVVWGYQLRQIFLFLCFKRLPTSAISTDKICDLYPTPFSVRLRLLKTANFVVTAIFCDSYVRYLKSSSIFLIRFQIASMLRATSLRPTKNLAPRTLLVFNSLCIKTVKFSFKVCILWITLT